MPLLVIVADLPGQQSYGSHCMSLDSHLAELERRHDALKKEIEGEAMHLASDDLKLAELKRKKLHLKDEIQKVRDAMKPRSVH